MTTNPSELEASQARDASLAEELKRAEKTGESVETSLFTDDQVLARITDGIYRQPASALRELIANAYDADATVVTITTDAPRFGRISVADDGIGMSRETLVHLVNHIGGSAKRNRIGADLGFASKEDPTRTLSGRRLIGKIGIGLFSVSQLTRRFTIITKRSDNQFKLVAEVNLFTYSEDAAQERVPGQRTKTGSVRIHYVKTRKNDASHGTEIVLEPLQDAAKDMLRSKDIWDRTDDAQDTEGTTTFALPVFHIGQIDPSDEETVVESPRLPWTERDAPKRRFEKLHAAVLAERLEGNQKPSLERTLDRYLRTLWDLALSAPLVYLGDHHPFDLRGNDGPQYFTLSNKKGAQAQPLEAESRVSLRKELDLQATSPHNFSVIVDQVELFRPLGLRSFPDAKTSVSGRATRMFIGQFSGSLEKMAPESRGGAELAFEAYFILGSSVLPTEHRGILVRINDASGTLFDRTFFSYKISEIRRLEKISGEVFVKKGLDAALNIDRESFNFGHPHAKLLASWVHRAVLQITNADKRITHETREVARTTEYEKSKKRVREVLSRKLRQRHGEHIAIEFVPDVEEAKKRRAVGVVALRSPVVFAEVPKKPKGAIQKRQRSVFEAQIQGIAEILSRFGLLEHLTFQEQEELLAAIVAVLKERG